MKILKDLQQKVDEAMESVKAIQGEQFHQLLGLIMSSSQHMRLMAMMTNKYPDDQVMKTAANHAASTLAKASSMVADAYKFDDDKMSELMKWVETLDGHIVGAMKEASRE